MAVHIRLQRRGAKKHPIYKVVVIDSKDRRDGRSIEVLGDYHPEEKEMTKKFFVNKERLDYWLSKGAKYTETVGQLIKASAK